MTPRLIAFLGRERADADEALQEDGVLAQEAGVLADALLDRAADFFDVRLPAVGKVGGDAPGPDEVVVHAQAGDRLEEAQGDLTLSPSVDEHRHGADVAAVRGLEQEVGGDAPELDEHHADPDRAGWNVEVEEPLDRHRVDELVRERREVVHAGHVRRALDVGELLAGLFHAGVEVADDGFRAEDRLTVELEHDPQDPVRGRVLGPHVDDHGFVFGPEAAEDDFATDGLHLLRALVGLVLEARLVLFRDLDGFAHRGEGSSLKTTGMRAGASSFRSGCPTQSSGMSRRVRSGCPSKVMPYRS